MVEIYADCAALVQIGTYAQDPRISGFTTNPSIMRKAGITKYRDFGKLVAKLAGSKPISLEVLADDFPMMEEQAREIASWGENVYVKIPVTNSRGESTVPLMERIADLKINVTAVMNEQQMIELHDRAEIISVFAGRIMDTGRLPPLLKRGPGKVLWASAREVYHVTMAEQMGYDIITLTPDLINKLPLKNKDLAQYSLETVRQFHEDGKTITW